MENAKSKFRWWWNSFASDNSEAINFPRWTFAERTCKMKKYFAPPSLWIINLFSFYATTVQEVLSKKCESITNKKQALAKGNHLLLTILLQFQWLKLLRCFMLRIMIVKNRCKCTMLNFSFSSSSFSLPYWLWCIIATDFKVKSLESAAKL